MTNRQRHLKIISRLQIMLEIILSLQVMSYAYLEQKIIRPYSCPSI
jgi:hypothetical protein